MEYDSYIKTLPDAEVQRLYDESVYTANTHLETAQELASELAIRNVQVGKAREEIQRIFAQDYVSPEVVEG